MGKELKWQGEEEGKG